MKCEVQRVKCETSEISPSDTSALKIKRSAFDVPRAERSSPQSPHLFPKQIPATHGSSTLVNAPPGDIFLQLSETCADPIPASPLRPPGASPRSSQPAIPATIPPRRTRPTRPMHPDGGSVPATKQARPEPVEGPAGQSLRDWKCEVQSAKFKKSSCGFSRIPRRGTRNAFLHPMTRAGRVSKSQKSAISRIRT